MLNNCDLEILLTGHSVH